MICLASWDGLGVADLGALVLLSSPRLGVSFAEPLVRQPNQKFGYPLVFPSALHREGKPASAGQAVKPGSGPGLGLESGNPSV